MKPIIINGIEYNQEIIGLAKQLMKIRGQEFLIKDDVDTLFHYACHSESAVRSDVWTLHYIRDEFPFEEGAKILFDKKMNDLEIV